MEIADASEGTFERGDDGQPADEFGDHAELDQIVRYDLIQ